MSEINWPNNPEIGDEYTDPSGSIWKFNGYGWNKLSISFDVAEPVTGTVITFENRKIYNTPIIPEDGELTNDLTGARLGIIQKIYHNSMSPITVPIDWVLLGDGIYFTEQLNIIYAEWTGGVRVEYWITQEQ